MKKYFLFFYLLFLPEVCYPVFFKHLGVREGLSQLSVMAVHQDELGRLWFGTYEGVSIYDGEKFRNLKPLINPNDYPGKADKIKASNTFPIVSDKNHNIFLKTDYALVKYSIQTDEIYLLAGERVSTVASINGEIWIARGDTLFQWIDEERRLQPELKTGLTGTIHKIHCSANKTWWIGTSHGLYRKTHTDAQPVCMIPRKDIAEIYEASTGDIWIGCRMEGMYRIDRNGIITEFLHQPGNPNSIISNQVRAFLEDNKGNFWVGTFEGIQKYDQKSGNFILYSASNQPGDLSHSSVFSLYQDRQGTIWVGTYYGGVNYFNPDTDIFTYYTVNPNREDCLSHIFVGGMVEDRNQDIWICTEGGGLNKLNRKTGTFKHFMATDKRNEIAHNNLKAITYDEQQHCLYIGTHTGGVSKYDISNGLFTNYLQRWKNKPDTPDPIIHSLQLYGDSLLIMARNGLFIMNIQNESVSYLYPEKRNMYYNGQSILMDSQKMLWISQSGRLLKVNMENDGETKIWNFGENGLGNFMITQMLETSEGEIYFATRGSGVYRFFRETDTFESFTVENGKMISNHCYNIAETQQGNIIVTTDTGLTFFLPEKGSFEHVPLGKNGLIVSAFNEGCGLLVAGNGEIFAGATDGLTTFFENDLFGIEKPYEIYFSQLQISNDLITPGDGTKILKETLPYTHNIELKHNQNNFFISFASNNYVGMFNTSVYEYMLDGFDTEWIPTRKTSINYTNLNPGNYILKIREIEFNRNKNIHEIQMGIRIKAPFYATPFSYVLYTCIFLTIVITFIYFQYIKIKLKTSLDIEKKEKEQIEEINQAKLRFFTNISHEFRTPLTLIISQVEVLLQNSGLSPTVYNKILKIYKHTYQMRRLISELLDFRKFEQKHVILNISENNLVSFVKEIFLNFYEYSVSHHITYTFQSRQEIITAWFDPAQMQKVLYNLLSNAFKYTKAHGFIEVIITETNEKTDIQVIDNGVGIGEKDIDRIFDHFYQAGHPTDQLPGTGTGIGLSLTKSIVESHHGHISVKSQPGYGSIFTVSLKKGNQHFINDPNAVINPGANEVTIKPDTLPDPVFMEAMTESPDMPITNETKDDRYSILIVEDHEELLQTLFGLFNPLYNVTLVRNGEEALQKAIDEQPDLILSDIMMPRMTGTEMCMCIKSNIDLCHIPVVLLTALTSNEQNMEGLQRGADDYIGKPFNARLLIVRCNNLIRNRRLIQNKYRQEIDSDTRLLATNKLDLHFIGRVEKIILDNLDNPEFDVNQLAQEMALGRSTLFSKFKGLTGMTPNEFILNYKLKMAAHMLRNKSELQIADISDQLGFSSARYFSRCFKAQFSVSPVDYRKGTNDNFEDKK